jgi:hypothetical protein
MVVIENFDVLIEYLKKRQPKLITVDGRDGAGKTYLAGQIHKILGGTHLTEDPYRTTDLANQFVPKYDDLILDMVKGLNKGLVIYDSVLMRWILENCDINPGLTVYVKRMSPMGLWGDESELDDEMSRGEAISQIPRRDVFNFRRQIINYHFDYLPHKKSDIVYHRFESETI